MKRGIRESGREWKKLFLKHKFSLLLGEKECKQSFEFLLCFISIGCYLGVDLRFVTFTAVELVLKITKSI